MIPGASIIDAHQHFWRIGENDCTWPTPDLAAIHRNFEPEDLAHAVAGLGIAGSVLVQTQPSDADTDWLLGLAANTETVKAVVGWADLASPHAPDRIAALAARPKLRGLRPMLQSLPEDDWILRSELAPAIAAMIAHDLSFDALVFTRHLPHLYAFAAHNPNLRIVIDHCAKPPIAAGELEPWRSHMARLAELPNLFCKLSGLFNEAGPGQDRAALAPYIDHVVECFGPSRLMWGGDWPVLLLAGAYGEWLEFARAQSGLKGADLDMLCAGTARAFYRC
jgi:L-fuconolactonase